MKNNKFGIGLILGTIFLFIGVGIQPVFAVENISINRSSENIEDCNCQVVDDFNLEKYKNQIGKLETYSKLLLTLSKNNPEIKVEYQKVLKDIDLFKEIFENIENNLPVDGRPICDKLADLFWTLFHRSSDYIELANDYLYEGRLILSFINFIITIGVVLLSGLVWNIYILLGCGTVPEY